MTVTTDVNIHRPSSSSRITLFLMGKAAKEATGGTGTDLEEVDSQQLKVKKKKILRTRSRKARTDVEN